MILTAVLSKAYIGQLYSKTESVSVNDHGYLGNQVIKEQNQSRTNGPINAHLTIAQV